MKWEKGNDDTLSRLAGQIDGRTSAGLVRVTMTRLGYDTVGRSALRPQAPSLT
jgi:hypothetical protein